MADNTLSQPELSPATPKLVEELVALEARVRRMETLLHGAESILSTIRYDGHLCYTPADEDYAEQHRRAYRMIDYLSEQIENWRESEAEFDFAADDILALKERAESGRLVRYGKPIPEPETSGGATR